MSTTTRRATLINPVRATGRAPFGWMPVTAAKAVRRAAAMSQTYQSYARTRLQAKDHGRSGANLLFFAA